MLLKTYSLIYVTARELVGMQGRQGTQFSKLFWKYNF